MTGKIRKNIRIAIRWIRTDILCINHGMVSQLRKFLPDILRDIYSHRQVITGLEIWLAKNPATPKDVLDEIAHRAK